MRESVKEKVQRIAVLSLVAFFSISIGSASFAANRTGTRTPAIVRTEQAFEHPVDRQKVLAVVANRTHDGKVLERFKDKLEDLSDRKLRLVVSLCERITRDDDRLGADIAFSLMTALVVLS